MHILNILTVGNDAGTLANEAIDLTKADILSSKIQTLIEDMKDTCHAVGGHGLAANQVGAPANLFIYRNPANQQLDVLVNPVIISKKGSLHSKGEGCLSLPDRFFNVKRFKKVMVEGLDAHGNQITIATSSKNLARILQHEIDHLQGITIADKGKEVRER